ncbi:MAG: Crp/Fnr family transcriptional regulator [Firmicutes bacterium]|nr:Crp/Fnr family transcriptional regulator [Bacillota bacterium]
MPQANPKLEYLRHFPLFGGLDEGMLQKINDLALERRYKGGMFIFLQGEPVDAVHFLRSGMVKATRTSDDGREQIMSILYPGDFFPHVGFLDGGPAPGTTMTMSETVLSVLRREDFVRLIKENATIFIHLLRVMEQRIRILQDQVESLGLRSVPSRLAGIILKLAEERGEARKGGTFVRLPLSQQELAYMIGTTRETVSRVLGDLRRHGAIALEREGILIQDQEALERWT